MQGASSSCEDFPSCYILQRFHSILSCHTRKRTSPFNEERTLTEEHKTEIQDMEAENPGPKSHCATNSVTWGNSFKSLWFGFLSYQIGIIKPDLSSRAIVKINTDTWKHTL